MTGYVAADIYEGNFLFDWSIAAHIPHIASYV